MAGVVIFMDSLNIHRGTLGLTGQENPADGKGECADMD